MTPQQTKRPMDLRKPGHQLSKSAAKLGFTAKREQIRRFGEYAGEDGLDTPGPNGGIWQPTPCK